MCVCVLQNPSALLSYLLSMALKSCPGHLEVNNNLSIICLLDFLANSSNVCWFGKVLGLGMCSNVCWFGNVFEICTVLFSHVCEQFEHLFRDRVEVSGTILESIQRSVITRSQHRRASLETWVHSEHTGIISTVPTLTLPSTKELSKDLCLR